MARDTSTFSTELGSLIFFATEVGQVAFEKSPSVQAHSPFTAALLSYLKQPGNELGNMPRHVTQAVVDDTGNLQARSLLII